MTTDPLTALDAMDARSRADAQAAWLAYRDGPMRLWPRRQIRRREYIAGYLAANDTDLPRATKALRAVLAVLDEAKAEHIRQNRELATMLNVPWSATATWGDEMPILADIRATIAAALTDEAS